jgi:hypothetical protein
MGFGEDKNLESTIREILKSHAQSRIYLYLLKNGKAKTEDIIQGTKLHPSGTGPIPKLWHSHKTFRVVAPPSRQWGRKLRRLCPSLVVAKGRAV